MAEKLSKKLTLFDVYSVSTGAMFSSGFFLLPGLAAMETGNSVFLAYLAAGILIIPSMLSVAELSTAMPKAGGAYYFLDRSLGPLIGTIGGLGSWVALILKSAFALIGMGAYLTIFVDVPMLPLALVLTAVFGLLNIFGAKETAILQRVLVAALVVIMAFFLIQGLNYIYIGDNILPPLQEENFFTNGINGFISTIGLVFVSYAGLTKVASIAEEVQNPDKVIPLGMLLSLLTASVVYVVGVFILLKVLPADIFFASLTPVADGAKEIMSFLPSSSGVVLIVIAAIAAFASTGNAGIMSASRYPLAMSRDRLMGPMFNKIGKFKTPYVSVIVTTIVMALVLVLFNVATLAKLASAFQLLLFFLLNLSVIVMRESRIEAYEPGYKSHLYPWMQIAGMIVSLWLIAEMGLLAVGLTGTLVIACIAWYFYYAQDKVERQGAIYHIHARLGQLRHEALEHELMTIINEKNEKTSFTYEEVIAKSIIEKANSDNESFKKVIGNATRTLSKRLNVDESEIRRGLSDLENDFTKLKDGVFFNFVRLEHIDVPEMIAIQSVEGITIKQGNNKEVAYALLFLVTPTNRPLLHMRIIGHLAELIQSEDFVQRWKDASDLQSLKEVLLSDERFMHIKLSETLASREWIGKRILEMNLPGECLIAIIERQGEIIIPKGDTVLNNDDQLSILGYPDDIHELKIWLKNN